jgi:hypothetical protein
MMVQHQNFLADKSEHGQPSSTARPENGPVRPLILARRARPGQRNLARLTRRPGQGRRFGRFREGSADSPTIFWPDGLGLGRKNMARQLGRAGPRQQFFESVFLLARLARRHA